MIDGSERLIASNPKPEENTGTDQIEDGEEREKGEEGK